MARRRNSSKLGQPAISVDTKKKEQVGDYKNGGREWHPKGQPEPVQVHDFGGICCRPAANTIPAASASLSAFCRNCSRKGSANFG